MLISSGGLIGQLVPFAARPVAVIVALAPLPGPGLARGRRGRRLAPRLLPVPAVVRGLIVGRGELPRGVITGEVASGRPEVHGRVVGRGVVVFGGGPARGPRVVTAACLRSDGGAGRGRPAGGGGLTGGPTGRPVGVPAVRRSVPCGTAGTCSRGPRRARSWPPPPGRPLRAPAGHPGPASALLDRAAGRGWAAGPLRHPRRRARGECSERRL